MNESDPIAEKNPIKLGGLELWVNRVKVAHTVLPEFTDVGSRTFTPLTTYKINGHDPAVVMLGCGYNYAEGKYDYFGPGEFDELALWRRPLAKNATVDETIFFLGGFGKGFLPMMPLLLLLLFFCC